MHGRMEGDTREVLSEEDSFVDPPSDPEDDGIGACLPPFLHSRNLLHVHVNTSNANRVTHCAFHHMWPAIAGGGQLVAFWCGQLVWPACVGSHNSQSVTVTSLWWNRQVSQLIMTLNCRQLCLNDLITCSCTKSLGHKVHHRPCTHSPLARMNPQPRTRSARYSCEELSCAECSYFIVVSHNGGLAPCVSTARVFFLLSFFLVGSRPGGGAIESPLPYQNVSESPMSPSDDEGPLLGGGAAAGTRVIASPPSLFSSPLSQQVRVSQTLQ